jgi:N-methylhydantoinase B
MRKIADPVFLEISWSRIISFVDEAAAALVRTAFSPIIREAEDYAVVLFDGNGNSLASRRPARPRSSARCRKPSGIFRRHADEGWHPGDVVITNDPWIGSGHLQDISMVAPISAGPEPWSRSAAWSRIRPTWAGAGPRRTVKSTKKACRLPICKLMRRGEPNTDVFNIIRRNVRVPDQVIGDIYAMMASCSVAADRLDRIHGRNRSRKPRRARGRDPHFTETACASASRKFRTALTATSTRSTATTTR